MGSERVSGQGLEELRELVSGRDMAVVGQVAELRLMTTHQIAAVHFLPDVFPSAAAALRACHRCLNRLTAERVLVRLERRVGGLRAGSSQHVYGLGRVGQRLLDRDDLRRHYREPSATFVDHTLAVSQFIVDITSAARQGVWELLACQVEPRCWRRFAGTSGRTVLRPDAYLSLGIGEYEHRYFIEIDRGSEHLPALLTKCRLYQAYYRSGNEQQDGGVFPRVCWVMPGASRAQRLKRAIAAERRLTGGLFIVTTSERVLPVLGGEDA